MSPAKKNIFIKIQDLKEQKKILDLLENTGYSVELLHSAKMPSGIHALIASCKDKTVFDKTHVLFIVDQFDEIPETLKESPSVQWIKRPYSDNEFIERVRRIIRRHTEQSAHARRKDRVRRMTRKLEDLAVTDPLTGLYNLRYFHPQLQREVNRARRYGTPVSLLLIDLDHFKAINDRYGHPVGDGVLQKIAEIFRNFLRTLDIPCRYGGDEFGIILPNTNKRSAQLVADKLVVCMSEINQKEWVIDDPIGMSIGIAEAPSDTVDATELIHLADRMLYQNKKQRVELK